MPPQPNEVLDTVLRLHEENKKEWSGIRSLLLDFNERLVITEQTGKYAEQFRLLLLQEISKVGEKVDKLHDLPGKVESLQQQFETLAATVKRHDEVFFQAQGGWFAAKVIWIFVAGIAGFVASLVVHWFTTGKV